MATTLIKSLSGKRFRVRKVVDPSGAVRGKVRYMKGLGWMLTLTLTRKPKVMRGKLKVSLDRRDQKALELSYGVRHAFAIRRGAVQKIAPPTKKRPR